MGNTYVHWSYRYRYNNFTDRMFLLARRYASAGASYGPVSVCLSQVGVLSKQMKGLIWFLV